MHCGARLAAVEQAPVFWHVSSSENRSSIAKFGLDWDRMQAARGIAGSTGPEQQGCFLCLDEGEVSWFVDMNNTGGPVDVWQVRDVDPSELTESPEGHMFLPQRIPAARVSLVLTDIPPRPRRGPPCGSEGRDTHRRSEERLLIPDRLCAKGPSYRV